MQNISRIRNIFYNYSTSIPIKFQSRGKNRPAINLEINDKY